MSIFLLSILFFMKTAHGDEVNSFQTEVISKDIRDWDQDKKKGSELRPFCNECDEFKARAAIKKMEYLSTFLNEEEIQEWQQLVQERKTQLKDQEKKEPNSLNISFEADIPKELQDYVESTARKMKIHANVRVQFKSDDAQKGLSIDQEGNYKLFLTNFGDINDEKIRDQDDEIKSVFVHILEGHACENQVAKEIYEKKLHNMGFFKKLNADQNAPRAFGQCLEEIARTTPLQCFQEERAHDQVLSKQKRLTKQAEPLVDSEIGKSKIESIKNSNKAGVQSTDQKETLEENIYKDEENIEQAMPSEPANEMPTTLLESEAKKFAEAIKNNSFNNSKKDKQKKQDQKMSDFQVKKVQIIEEKKREAEEVDLTLLYKAQIEQTDDKKDQNQPQVQSLSQLFALENEQIPHPQISENERVKNKPVSEIFEGDFKTQESLKITKTTFPSAHQPLNPEKLESVDKLKNDSSVQKISVHKLSHLFGELSQTAQRMLFSLIRFFNSFLIWK